MVSDFAHDQSGRLLFYKQDGYGTFIFKRLTLR